MATENSDFLTTSGQLDNSIAHISDPESRLIIDRTISLESSRTALEPRFRQIESQCRRCNSLSNFGPYKEENVANNLLGDLQPEADAWEYSFTLSDELEFALLKTNKQDNPAPVLLPGHPDACMWKSTWDDIFLGENSQFGRFQEYPWGYIDFEPDSELDNRIGDFGFSFSSEISCFCYWCESCRHRWPDCIPPWFMGFRSGDHPWHSVKPWYPVIPRSDSVIYDCG